MTGPIIILIREMNASPNGFSAVPVFGYRYPTSTPTVMAIRTCTYSTVYQGRDGFGAPVAGPTGVSTMTLEGRRADIPFQTATSPWSLLECHDRVTASTALREPCLRA